MLNNDFWHPVHLAREVAAIDHVTDGRFELGIGAGHAHTEYAAIGATFDPPGVRKERMAEAIEIVRRLLDGEEVTHHGAHYSIDAVRTMRSHQEHLPIFVGVNGREALAHAARHADIIGLTMLGKTLPDGHQHEVRWQSARLDATIDHIVGESPGRTPELNVLVQRLVVTDDREAAAAELLPTSRHSTSTTRSRLRSCCSARTTRSWRRSSPPATGGASATSPSATSKPSRR